MCTLCLCLQNGYFSYQHWYAPFVCVCRMVISLTNIGVLPLSVFAEWLFLLPTLVCSLCLCWQNGYISYQHWCAVVACVSKMVISHKNVGVLPLPVFAEWLFLIQMLACSLCQCLQNGYFSYKCWRALFACVCRMVISHTNVGVLSLPVFAEWLFLIQMLACSLCLCLQNGYFSNRR